MKKIFEGSYLLLIFFILFIFKDSIYNLINIENYRVDNCIYLKNMESNYNDLLEFSNIKLNYQMDYVNSYVVYKDVYNYKNNITILKGKQDNIKKNDAVIYNNTLIGIIDKVKDNVSNVEVITNKNSKISVSINDEVGILEFDNVLKITGISNYGNISIGDEIYTSGLGKISKNIFIGKVSNIILDKKNIEKIIYLDYNLDLKDINYVTILKNQVNL